MSSKTFPLGFIGGALNSAVGYAHFVSAQLDNKWKLEAGTFSRDPQTNAQTAAGYGVSRERTHANLQDLLQAEKHRLKAVALLTPTDQHFEMLKSCLKAKIPVICEKSLTQTSEQAAEIEKLRREHSGFLAMIYNYSGYPMIREMRRMIQQGRIGDILHFQAEMPQEGYIRTDSEGNKPAPQDWRLRDGPVPTLHLDLAVHLHAVLYYLIGHKPLEVVADQGSRGWFDVVDHTACLCRYSGGVQGQLWFSKCALGHRNGLRFRIYGSSASIEWYQGNPEELLISHANGRREIFDRASGAEVSNKKRYERFKAGHPAGFNEALANLYFDIYEALASFQHTGRMVSDEVFSSDLALEGLRFLEAMVRSVHSRKWEQVTGS